MLAQLGSVIFEVSPFNMHEVDHDTGADFAEKGVLGRRPPLEFVGEAPEAWTVNCRIFPEKFGGLDDLNKLHQQRIAGKAIPFMRGDGVPYGWVVIERIADRSTFLNPQGVGKVVEIDISVKRVDAPSGDDVHAALAGVGSGPKTKSTTTVPTPRPKVPTPRPKPSPPNPPIEA